MMRKYWVTGLAITVAVVVAAGADAAVLVNQNFNSLGTTGTAPPSGWTVGHLNPVKNRDSTGGEGAAIVSETLIVDNGSMTGSSNGESYNYGTTGSNDRALGSIPRTPNGDHIIQVAVTNTTGYPLTSLTISYWGEQWHRGESKAASQPEKLRMFFSMTSATTGFVRMSNAGDTSMYDFIAPENNNILPQAAIDGNDKHTYKTGVYTPASPIPAGGTFYVRWYDYNDDQTLDHGLAIDDVVIDGVPEPASLALIALGGFVLLRRR